MKHKLAVLVENNPGVLAKVSNLFSRRGYNIESLVVSDTEDKTISRMTIVVEGDEKIIEQLDYTGKEKTSLGIVMNIKNC